MGTALPACPTATLALCRKSRYDDWKVMEKTLPENEAPRTFIETLPNAEHFAVLPDGTPLMGKAARLYKYK